MDILTAILSALVALFILVTVHEYGHFWVARKCGVRVERFSIGFGKPFARFTHKGTEFALAPIPLGGYVKMYGEAGSEEDMTEEDKAVSFSHKTVWQRMAIVLAGPIANFLLAILLYWVVFLGGLNGYLPLVQGVQPDSPLDRAGLQIGDEERVLITAIDGQAVDTWRELFDGFIKRVGETGDLRLTSVRVNASAQPISSPIDYTVPISRWQGDTDTPEFIAALGLVPYSPELRPVVGEIVPGGAAERAGLMAGDEILAADGESMESWLAWRLLVSARPDQAISLTLLRDGRRMDVQIVPEAVEVDGGVQGRVGVIAEQTEWPEAFRRSVEFGPLSALQEGAEQTGRTSVLILDSLKKLVTGQISTKSLGGPISIARFAGASADAGWQSFLMFMAGLSVMLGVVNLLPIPVLDGGHFVFYVIEAIKGSPLNEAVQAVAMRFGMATLLCVMLLALYNDFGRL